jgi:putative nucleotide binding protein
MNTKEEYAIVLDFLPNGYPMQKGFKNQPVVQAIGKTTFILLELVPKKDVKLKAGDEVYIGTGKRDHVHHINGRLPLLKLTNASSDELPILLKRLIELQSARFVDFFNKSQPLSMRMHQLELLPGLGKKLMWEVIDERSIKPFESFDDLKARAKVPNPEGLVFKRVLKELEGEEKHYLFVKQDI